MQTYLVIRFSSFGDVMLTLPILESAARDHRDHRFILVTKSQYARYALEISGVTVFEVDTSKEFRGIGGLIRLSRILIELYQPVGVIDLHSVIRSRLLSFLFTLSGLPVFHLLKGRRQKRKAISHQSKLVLPHLTEKYINVFVRAGVQIEAKKLLPLQAQGFHTHLNRDESRHLIGFAPLAKHPTKTWPLDKSIELARSLVNNLGASVHLFGGIDEKQILESMVVQDGIQCRIGQLNTREEVELIRKLDVMITMDSGNMHLAAILGIPVVSLWGATHPRLGYSPLFQPEQNQVQPDRDLPCRPCSLYGNRPCRLKQEPLKCLTTITVEQVMKSINRVMKNLKP